MSKRRRADRRLLSDEVAMLRVTEIRPDVAGNKVSRITPLRQRRGQRALYRKPHPAVDRYPAHQTRM
jgi:hypothetical protein